MQSKILVLLSELRGIDWLINRFETSFPSCEIIPLLFVNDGSCSNHNGYHLITHAGLRNFCSTYDYTGVKLIYVSFMTGDKLSFIKLVPCHIKVVWAMPGGDLYNRYLRYFGYPLIYGENKSLKYAVGKIVRYYSRRKEFNFLMNRLAGLDSAYCDYKLIKYYTPKRITTPIHIYNFGYPIEKTLGSLIGKEIAKHKERKIVVGNSASRTNNHLYVLKCLNKAGIKDASLSLFLSYGNDDRYKAEVFSKYVQAYKEKVTFITDFLPLDDFNHVLLSATHFIYGNWRQEAVGNILTALYLGGKVYLSHKNPLLEDFREKGFHIYCLEEINVDFYEEMTEEEKTWNRGLITKLYNEERAQELFKKGLMPFLKS